YVGTYYQSNNAGPKWFQDRSGQWFYLTATGDLKKGNSLASSTLVANLSPLVFDDPTQLFNAPVAASGDTLVQLSQLEGAYGFRYLGSYYQTNGQGVKWFQDKNGLWYFLTATGDLDKWNSISIAGSSLKPVASLSPLVYDDPTILFGAG